MSDEDDQPISAAEARALFAAWRRAPALVIAVSGGPDSVALLWLLARWRRTLKGGPQLVAVTVDHGLRPASAKEAGVVKRLAASLDILHITKRWTGPKPKTGLPAAARVARYRLLAQAARKHHATHIVTAHTRDDQAETLLMRLMRGSGLAGLGAMARETPRGGVVLARPLIDVPKLRLAATLRQAKIAFADDPTNSDPKFTRPRLRAILPVLAAEGLDARVLTRLAARMKRADAALDLMTDQAESTVGWHATGRGEECGARAYAMLPEEIRVRLLWRSINRVGHEGPAELGKVEALAAAIDSAGSTMRLKQTLAGALVTLSPARLTISPAPRRRGPDRGA